MEAQTLNRRPWSEEDDVYIRSHYHEDGALAVAGVIHRSCGSVRKRAHFIRISKPQVQIPWSEKDDLILKKLRRTKTTAEIAAKLGRTPASILSHASEIGLSTPPREPWTKRELDTVRKYYPTTSMRELSRMLNRTLSAVHKMVTRFGLKKNVRWDANANKRFRLLCLKGYDDDALAAAFGSTRIAMHGHRYTLGL